MTTETALVIAPHPDDEVLGVGGTIARLSARGVDVHVAVVTRGQPPMFSDHDVERTRAEARRAHDLLGVRQTHYLDFPAAQLDVVPHADVNRGLTTLVRSLGPSTVFIPFNGDIHLDHQRVNLSALVACRPNTPSAPRFIYAYETLSETNWNAPYVTASFQPNVFFDITSYLAHKLDALRCFASQLQPFPSERSLEAVEALARLRGASVACRAAEAFVLVRAVYRED